MSGEDFIIALNRRSCVPGAAPPRPAAQGLGKSDVITAMELLLTPLVSSLLRKFIKSSAESAGGELKVSFSTRGALTLHNLELNLEPLLEGVSFITAKRAFARTCGFGRFGAAIAGSRAGT